MELQSQVYDGLGTWQAEHTRLKVTALHSPCIDGSAKPKITSSLADVTRCTDDGTAESLNRSRLQSCLLLQSRLREVDNASLRLDEARRKHYKGAQKELKVTAVLHPAEAAGSCAACC
jgi:hypothetical protein